MLFGLNHSVMHYEYFKIILIHLVIGPCPIG